MVCGEEAPMGTKFPLEAPYKTLYSVYALEEALSQKLRHVKSLLILTIFSHY